QSGCTIVSFVATLIRGADVAARHPYLAGVQDAPLFTLPRKRATHRKHKRPRPLVALLRTPWWASPSHREALRKPLPDGADSCHVAEVISCMSQIPDPFLESRKKDAVLKCTFQGESLPMILRHRDVREACKDWKTFSSDAPFRVPIPSEEEVRTMRQLPIETNPPEHTEYRAIVEPFFQRAKLPEMISKVEGLMDEKLTEALARDSVEVVEQFALPVQSRSLTYLLNVPESEAQTWIAWGIHVFKGAGGTFKKENVLEAYLAAQLDRAAAKPGPDFFSALTTATYRGRRLTREEMMGFGNLTFAGGR